ncbi:hypothetical protein [Staphylococcus americanisciuri]|uniref:DUF3278 domain-containing protein n=1 Tax=Staphylococcus americanisciuri TaxID=2973940 RepID=A0ABT2F0U2_9STAP|nr:hypothetical protein [Staphylococcus americanisciuri]MCS4486076.1 hypothetical protein [Staphylococcus americanisciuri]
MRMYKRFVGIKEPDEYQQSKIDETLALVSIIGVIGLFALTPLSWMIDLESEQLSVFSIGALILLFVIGARTVTLTNDNSMRKFYVETEEAAHQLRRKLTFKYIVWMLLGNGYLLLVTNVLAPLFSGKSPYWYGSESVNFFLLSIPMIIFVLWLRKQVQVRKDEDNGY